MIKNRIFVLFAAFAALLFTSCISQDKVKMVGVENFIMVGEDRFDVIVRIENRNGSNLTIKNASIALVEDQTELIVLSLAEKLVIPSRSNQGMIFPVVMRMSNPGVLSTLPERAKSDRPLMVQGQITGQASVFSKNYKIGPMPVEEFLSMLDEANRDMIRGFIY